MARATRTLDQATGEAPGESILHLHAPKRYDEFCNLAAFERGQLAALACTNGLGACDMPLSTDDCRAFDRVRPMRVTFCVLESEAKRKPASRLSAAICKGRTLDTRTLGGRRDRAAVRPARETLDSTPGGACARPLIPAMRSEATT